MFGSVNVLNTLYASEFTPLDLIGALGVNAGLTYYACESDSFRIQTPVIGEKIEEMVGDRFGWVGDARFILGLVPLRLRTSVPDLPRRLVCQ